MLPGSTHLNASVLRRLILQKTFSFLLGDALDGHFRTEELDSNDRAGRLDVPPAFHSGEIKRDASRSGFFRNLVGRVQGHPARDRGKAFFELVLEDDMESRGLTRFELGHLSAQPDREED